MSDIHSLPYYTMAPSLFQVEFMFFLSFSRPPARFSTAASGAGKCGRVQKHDPLHADPDAAMATAPSPAQDSGPAGLSLVRYRSLRFPGPAERTSGSLI